MVKIEVTLPYTAVAQKSAANVCRLSHTPHVLTLRTTEGMSSMLVSESLKENIAIHPLKER